MIECQKTEKIWLQNMKKFLKRIKYVFDNLEHFVIEMDETLTPGGKAAQHRRVEERNDLKRQIND